MDRVRENTANTANIKHVHLPSTCAEPAASREKTGCVLASNRVHSLACIVSDLAMHSSHQLPRPTRLARYANTIRFCEETSSSAKCIMHVIRSTNTSPTEHARLAQSKNAVRAGRKSTNVRSRACLPTSARRAKNSGASEPNVNTIKRLFGRLLFT